jgi:hypothetical protein
VSHFRDASENFDIHDVCAENGPLSTFRDTNQTPERGKMCWLHAVGSGDRNILVAKCVVD